jgi:serine/threonine protein kinase
MLTVDRKKRINTKDALNHPWFECTIASDSSSPSKKKFAQPVGQEVLTKLTEFKSESLLKQAALNIFVKTIHHSEMAHLREEFQAIDKEGTGFIDHHELMEAVQHH